MTSACEPSSFRPAEMSAPGSRVPPAVIPAARSFRGALAAQPSRVQCSSSREGRPSLLPHLVRAAAPPPAHCWRDCKWLEAAGTTRWSASKNHSVKSVFSVTRGPSNSCPRYRPHRTKLRDVDRFSQLLFSAARFAIARRRELGPRPSVGGRYSKGGDPHPEHHAGTTRSRTPAQAATQVTPGA